MEASRTSGSHADGGSSADRPMSELVQALSQQTSTLARMEVELAKAEVTEKGKQLGIGAGEFGAAAVLGFYAFGALTATFILVLATFLEGWIAALIVTVVYAAIAGVLALTGKKQVEKAGPLVPEQAIETTKQDIDTAKRGVKEGRS